MLGRAINTQANNSTLLFISCLCRTSRLVTGENPVPFQVFSECEHWHAQRPGYSHNPLHLYTQNRLEIFFKFPYGHFFPQLLVLDFVVSSLFTQLLSTASDSHDVQQLPLIVFQKYPWEKGCFHRTSSELGKIKTSATYSFCLSSGNRANTPPMAFQQNNLIEESRHNFQDITNQISLAICYTILVRDQ